MRYYDNGNKLVNKVPQRRVSSYIVLLFSFVVLTDGIAEEAVDVEGYYQPLKSSDNFVASLHVLISRHHYLSNKEIWSYLEASHESPVDPDAIILFYTRRVTLKQNKASGKDQAEPDHWNREHVWPQSFGLKGNKSRMDIHNVVPADRTVNTSRGNKYFDTGGKRHSECDHCFTDRDSWEPPDIVKGDVARILLYMQLRYVGQLDLQWTKVGRLFEWHCDDPVSALELRRNDIAYWHQGNRNPFIDHPEWVKKVFKRGCT